MYFQNNTLLITTIYFSTGLDQKWLSAKGFEQDGIRQSGIRQDGLAPCAALELTLEQRHIAILVNCVSVKVDRVILCYEV